jgi:hypothetical protein
MDGEDFFRELKMFKTGDEAEAILKVTAAL